MSLSNSACSFAASRRSIISDRIAISTAKAAMANPAIFENLGILNSCLEKRMLRIPIIIVVRGYYIGGGQLSVVSAFDCSDVCLRTDMGMETLLFNKSIS
jgi:hypothetical protein